MSSPLVPDNAARSNSRLATQLYWLMGLAPIATNIVTPLMVFWQMRTQGKNLMVKYNQQVNEVVRQFVSGTIGLVSYFGGGELTRGMLNVLNGIGIRLGQPIQSSNGRSQDDSNQKVAMLLGGIVMSFIGFAVIRPWIGTRLICKFLKEEGVEAVLTKPQLDAIFSKAKTEVERKQLVDKKLAEVAKEQMGGDQKAGFPIRQIQNWVDQNLFTSGKDGKPEPKLGKTAAVATLGLTGWLTALTGVLYGLNQALGGPKASELSSLPEPVRLKRLNLSSAPWAERRQFQAVPRQAFKLPIAPAPYGFGTTNYAQHSSYRPALWRSS